MNRRIKSALAIAATLATASALAQVTFYAREGFRGQAYSTSSTVRDFSRTGFNDKASSAIVERGRWEVCGDSNFRGRCVILRRGNYDTLASIGLENRISSVRPVGRRANANERPPVQAAPVYEYRQRPNERLFQAPVRSVRAVVGAPEQRCWVERQQVQGSRADLNVPGAVIGGVLGGILGHQIGGGSGRTAATVGGAVGGGALGANIDRIRGGGSDTRDVRRCENVANSGRPQYWDVDYTFRGSTHHVQMSSDPGNYVTVNGRGEPRE